MRDDVTVVYYTANREAPTFARKIQQTLLETIEGLPLVSVSQQPIDFGTNICVGAVGASSQNAYRQLQIGALEAKTRFVCTAEADMLYPRSYFEFVPPQEDTGYLASPLWILFAQRGFGKVFCEKPRGSEAAMVVGRACLIDGIERILSGYGTWGMLDANGDTFPYLMRTIPQKRFAVDAPVITIKTDQNMHRKTPHDPQSKVRSLAPWGEAHDLIRRYT
jgi:hypothetical protein